MPSSVQLCSTEHSGGGGGETPTHMQAWKSRMEIIIIVIVKSLQ